MTIATALATRYHELGDVKPQDTESTLKQYPALGISVLIVGAGTSGVFAALECWRKGLQVRIIEKAPGPSDLGM